MDKQVVKNFDDLDVWQKSNDVTIEIYTLTKAFPKDELFGITSQLRRAASSIGANIAEGFGRYHYKEKIRFYYIARGSAVEVQNFLLLSSGLEYIHKIVAEELSEEVTIVIKMLNGMIRRINDE